MIGDVQVHDQVWWFNDKLAAERVRVVGISNLGLVMISRGHGVKQEVHPSELYRTATEAANEMMLHGLYLIRAAKLMLGDE